MADRAEENRSIWGSGYHAGLAAAASKLGERMGGAGEAVAVLVRERLRCEVCGREPREGDGKLRGSEHWISWVVHEGAVADGLGVFCQRHEERRADDIFRQNRAGTAAFRQLCDQTLDSWAGPLAPSALISVLMAYTFTFSDRDRLWSIAEVMAFFPEGRSDG